MGKDGNNNSRSDSDIEQPPRKIKKSYDQNRKYLECWEKEFPWLTSVKSAGKVVAFCKLCRKNLQTHRGTLLKHEQGMQHKNTANSMAISRTINFPKKSKVTDDLKRAELELALITCCHCSIRTTDHMGEIIKRNGKGSVLEHLRLHRTKCTHIITSVISPSFKAELKKGVQGKKFSLLVDETTDISVEKLLAICIRYFDEDCGKILTAFLGLYPIVHATGEALFKAVKDSMTEYNICLSDCIGIACDGASVMVGEYNSVWSRIKEVSPNCILNKCVCHSLALCVQKSFEKLPANLGFLLADIPGWFSNSTVRRQAYKTLFESMHEPEEEEEEVSKSIKNTHMPFLKTSSTRWLVRGRVIKRLIENWNELRCYFSIAMQEGTQDVRYRARILHEMLCDEINYLYLIFLSPIVSEFEKINAFFQSTNSDPEMMTKELDLHYRGLKTRVFTKNGDKLSVSMSDLGALFNNELNRCSRENKNPNFVSAVVSLKQRCQDFLVDVIREVEKRIPKNKAIFQGISALHPSKVLSQTARTPFSQLPLQHLLKEDLNIYEEQYRKIICHMWSEDGVFENGIPDNSIAFWSGIFKYENGLGAKPYRKLALYALACLSCPVSNAVVERVFSQVTCVKTKYRNKMSLELLDSIVRIRTHLMIKDTNCVKFNITDDMIKRFTCDMYNAMTKK
ncbi:SCAN domain-containing protein 3-like [Palaemon carinicauda]|uniref:SCAN domain-containing protein 3-like n=1 Tax=Palaemon carinicauda TaxID=392227 RepID=UPI0035B61FEE